MVGKPRKKEREREQLEPPPSRNHIRYVSALKVKFQHCRYSLRTYKQKQNKTKKEKEMRRRRRRRRRKNKHQL
jgi:hypothetical protein